MAQRECPFCGKLVYERLTQCNYCRETLPEPKAIRTAAPQGGDRIRRGLLFMFMAAVMGYFVSGSSLYSLPVPVPQLVSNYLLPLLFLGGLGLSLYGVYLRHRASN